MNKNDTQFDTERMAIDAATISAINTLSYRFWKNSPFYDGFRNLAQTADDYTHAIDCTCGSYRDISARGRKLQPTRIDDWKGHWQYCINIRIGGDRSDSRPAELPKFLRPDGPDYFFYLWFDNDLKHTLSWQVVVVSEIREFFASTSLPKKLATVENPYTQQQIIESWLRSEECPSNVTKAFTSGDKSNNMAIEFDLRDYPQFIYRSSNIVL